jgi:hypothetical protein
MTLGRARCMLTGRGFPAVERGGSSVFLGSSRVEGESFLFLDGVVDSMVSF